MINRENSITVAENSISDSMRCFGKMLIKPPSVPAAEAVMVRFSFVRPFDSKLNFFGDIVTSGISHSNVTSAATLP